MRALIVLIFKLLCIVSNIFSQEKRDYQWIIGYDYSGPTDQIISMNFLHNPVFVSHIPTISDFGMEGSNTSMSDTAGNLLFYSNGCKIANAKGKLMLNGDSINPGMIQRVYCPGGGSPWRQGIIALPIPDSDSLYVIFNLDMDQPYNNTPYLPVAPQRLFYHVIDMSLDSGYGAVVLKNQIAIQDTFARGNISAVRNANGKDWWVIVPKSQTNCYFLIPVTSKGIQPAQLKCFGHVWSNADSGAQATFSPNLKKYIRFNSWNGLNIYDFDNATGEFSNHKRITFPNDTINYIAGVSVSPNSRYLYVSARRRVYQFDLQASDIEGSKIKVGEWDGTYDPYPSIFYLSALAPDGKIYISSTSSHLHLHVIERPNCPGLSCQLVQKGLPLPSFNFATIPNFPHYRMSNEVCDTTNSTDLIVMDNKALALYPNPTRGEIWINYPDKGNENMIFRLHDVYGRLVYEQRITEALSRMDVSSLKSGTYFYHIEGYKMTASGKIVKIE